MFVSLPPIPPPPPKTPEASQTDALWQTAAAVTLLATCIATLALFYLFRSPTHLAPPLPSESRAASAAAAPIASKVEPPLPSESPAASTSASAAEERIQRAWHALLQIPATHGTHSLYEVHFTTHGMTSAYPPALQDLMQRTHALWAAHEALLPMTTYFRGSIRRMKAGRTEISFSNSSWKIHEYTTGARFGGEWWREASSFLQAAKRNLSRFTPEETDVLARLEAFAELLRDLPCMKVHVPLTMMLPGEPSTLESFRARVQRSLPEWKEDDEALERFLLDYIQRIRCLEFGEIVLDHPVPREHLRCELVNIHPQRSIPPLPDGELLPFDIPTTLNDTQLRKQKILIHGLSLHPQYTGSYFVTEFLLDSWKITRRAIQGNPALEEEWARFQRILEHKRDLVTQLGCEEFARQFTLLSYE